jgi:hypothetical protein
MEKRMLEKENAGKRDKIILM